MEKAKGKKLFYRPAGKRKGMYTPTQIICVSFVIVIALGTFLLSLPVASKHGRLDVLDAMFTATSATCVTGLIVRDTWTQFTYFGQAVILLLIQVGGLGLVTLTSFFALAMRRRMGFRDLRLLGESVSADGYAQAKDVLKIVVGLAGLFEGIGIVLLLFAFVPQFGLEGIWVSVFTAISAFCNAGFDLFGRFGQYSSLAPYVNNYYVQAVVMFMIISGGLGFMVWVEIGQYRKKHRLSLQAKVVLSFSVILWLGGAALIALMEWNNPASMGGLSVPGKLMAALFQSVSTRTAGMNTIDLAACSPITKLLMSALAADMALLLAYNQWNPSLYMKTLRDSVMNYLGNNLSNRFCREDRRQMAAAAKVPEEAEGDAATVRAACSSEIPVDKKRTESGPRTDTGRAARARSEGADYDKLLDKMMQKILADG